MKKYDIPKELDYRYRVFSPSGRHTSYRISKRYPDGSFETVSHPALDSINKAMQDATFSKDEARMEVDKLVFSLYRQDGVRVRRVVSNQTNRKLLDDFFDAEYEHRPTKDREAAYNSYRRAVDAMGELSLITATSKEIASQLKKNHQGNEQRRRAGALESILKYYGRSMKIPRDREAKVNPRSITPDELDLILPHIEDPVFRLAVKVAFATGCRIGELLAIEPDKYNENTRYIFVDGQINTKGAYVETKNARVRHAVLLQFAKNDIWEWFERKGEFTSSMRNKAAERLRAASMKAFPNRKDKWIVFHDLRHSYVRYLLSTGMSLKKAADFIGDGVQVTEKYYAGWIVEEDEAEMILKMIDKPKGKTRTRT